MNSITHEHDKKYLLDSHEESFSSEPKAKDAFSQFVTERLEIIKETAHVTITKRMLADNMGIDNEMFRKIVNKEKPTKKRDCIIAICAMLFANSAETDDALERYNMTKLDSEYQRDDAFIDILENNSVEISSGILITPKIINDSLQEWHVPTLDLIEHRLSRKPVEPQHSMPVLDKRVETVSDELLYGDPYNSLDSCYSPDRFDISARMHLGDNKAAQYTLTATQYGDYYLIDRSKDSFPHRIHSLADAGSFRDCFLELQDMIRIEQRKMLGILNDTKNYHQRESAKIINGALHVFLESYSYAVPELNEYYLMDYSEGQYTLHVFGKSQFMRYYLSAAKYCELYGKAKIPSKATYTSIEDIHAERDTVPSIQKGICTVREWAFSELQRKVDTLIEALKSGEKHICNVDYVFEHPGELLERLAITKDFNCSYDEEFGAIASVGTDRALFETENGDQIELTIEDVSDGFSLGLYTIAEIVDFRQHHDSLKITDLL